MEKGYLQNQIYTYSLDTDCFYTATEAAINKKRLKYFGMIKKLDKIVERIDKYNALTDELECSKERKLEAESEMEIFDKKSDEFKQSRKDVKRLTKRIPKLKERIVKQEELVRKLVKSKKDIKEIISDVEKKSENVKNRLKKRIDYLENRLKIEIYIHKGIRTLRKDALIDKNKISQFESTLTRTLGINKNETTTEIFVIRAFRYSVFKSLMLNGFKYENELYQYYTSSAGGIRNKKSIFMKKKTYEKYNKTLLCGLTIEDINKKGGMNLNKFNSYQALCLTASAPWNDTFDIDKSIVVNDFETTIYTEVDVIDDETYEIERVKREPLTINHTDGAGICLPSVSDKSFQFRMPGFKGLMIPFPFDEYINDKCTGQKVIVEDIYGKKHDILEEGISIIFTKSQFKLWKFFIDDADEENSWEIYKNNFKDYKCEAVKCKIEEDEDGFQDKRISYQVLQTLNEMKKDDLDYLARRTNYDIDRIGKDIDVTLRVLGATDSNKKKDYFQQALEIYPELLADPYGKKVMTDVRESYIEDAKAGKLLISGTKRTYIAPDVYAFAEWLFKKEKKPTGILHNNEVSCALYEHRKELDLLRSPHNYREHCVKTNVLNESTEKWFITKDVYTSVHDPISKILMFDVDGDDSLIVSNELFAKIAKEHMKDIRPLKYKLAVADAEEINNPNMYAKLKSAYSKNIGTLAFSIAKVWNQPDVDKDKLKIIAQLCFESNATIDFAKTLWMPVRPPEVNKKIKEYTKQKLPHFFKYAKDKKDNQIVPIIKDKFVSVVNMLDEIIISNRNDFSSIDAQLTLDYTKLMKKKHNQINLKDEQAKAIIEVHTKENQQKYRTMKKQLKNTEDKDSTTKLGIYETIRNNILKVNDDVEYVTDVLVKYLYENNSEHKETLWKAFGQQIVINMKKNIVNTNCCKECGEYIAPRRQYCTDCAKERKKVSNKKADNKYKGKKRENKVS
ncbi:hypothetical protein ACTXGU_00075 [Niallia sp. 01092]|uniref:hypothetical protein n=1 Tax=Niallia sp. 01092 TaxID=3457759 RepID=UPI003FD37B5A